MDAGRLRITRQGRIDKENYRHIDLFMSFQPLIVEAKTLNFVEVDAGRVRRHVERRVSDYCSIAEVLCREKYELLLTKAETHFAPRRLESPRQVRRHIAVEPHGNGLIGNCVRAAVVPPKPVATQNRRYKVGEYATTPTMNAMNTMHGATTHRFLRLCRFIIQPLLRHLTGHGASCDPCLHGAWHQSFGWERHIDMASFLKLQRERKGLSLLERLFEPDDHHVHLARFENDLSSR